MVSNYFRIILNLFVHKVFASGTSGGVTLDDPLAGKNFEQVVASVIGGLFFISIPLVSIMVLVGGFQILTAGGDPEKFGAGKKTILYAAIGFAVVLAAQGVVLLIKNIFGVK